MVNSIEELLLALKAAEVELWVEDGRLRTRAPEGAITPALREQIKHHLDAIIALLQGPAKVQNDPFQQAIPALAPQPSYALSNAQQRLWILHQISNTPEALAAYNMPVSIRLKGQLNQEALQHALSTLHQRHEVLRTRFVEENGEGRQIIDLATDRPFRLEILDEQAAAGSSLEELTLAHAMYAFDLTNEHAFRATLVQIAKEEHLLLINMHHIISDGWSIGILVKEFSELYRAGIAITPQVVISLPDLPTQYKDYAVWQNSLLEQADFSEKLRAYWLATLKDLPTLDLPADYVRPAVKSFKGQGFSHQFNASFLQALYSLAERNGATPFMTMLALLKTLFYRYTRQNDLVIGSPSAGRAHPDSYHQLGFFVNTLVIRSQIEGKHPFETFLQKVKNATLAAFEHELYPFDRLIEDLQLPMDRSRSPIFEVMLVWQNNETSELNLGELALSYDTPEVQVSKFDLSLSFSEQQAGLSLHLEYNTDVYKAERIQRLCAHLEALLYSVIQAPTTPVDQLKLLPDTEQHALLNHFNPAPSFVPKDQTLIQLFEEQVMRSPDQIAITCAGRQLSYRELNNTANAWANFLTQKYALKPEDIVALQLERSEWMIVALLSVLKAGAAYLPVDVLAPAARLSYILQDSSARLLLSDTPTNDSNADLLGDFPVLSLSALLNEVNEGHWSGEHNPLPSNHPGNLAYVIYTSGSTGQPKGVLLEHTGIINMATAITQRLGVSNEDCVLQFAPFTFDASVWEIFSALLVGARLHLHQDRINTPEQFVEALAEAGVTLMTLPPALLATLDKERLLKLPQLRLVVTAGDKPNAEDVTKLAPKLRYINAYGPTEYSVCISLFDIPQEWNEPFYPIGTPLSNTEVFILDEAGQLCPIGVPGQLAVAGLGLARGYLNQAELNAKYFVPHLMQPMQRMYLTGDLARWLPDGNLEFLGRIDHQLKVRGYRIEPGEIESSLNAHLAIAASVVIGYQQELVAYFVLHPEQNPPHTAALQEFLGKTLPQYMIPSYFIALESLPMTSSGKVDKKRLPAPIPVQSQEYVAPRTELEVKLSTIWSAILDRPEIGIYDNFFQIGGHSLRAMRLVSQINQALNLSIKIDELFNAPSIAALADKIEQIQILESMQYLPSDLSESNQELEEEIEESW